MCQTRKNVSVVHETSADKEASSITLEGIFVLSKSYGLGISDDDNEDCEGSGLPYFKIPVIFT